MDTAQFPTDPGRRRTIFVLASQDLESLHLEDEGRELFDNEEIYLAGYPLGAQGDSCQALRELEKSGLARPGVILVQNPYDCEQYEDARLAPRTFSLAKHHYTSQLCMFLGAKETEITQIQKRIRNSAGKMVVAGEYRVASGEGSVEDEDCEKLIDQITLKDTFPGAAPDLPAAERLLEEKGLRSDITMSGLLDMRRDGNNKLESRTLSMNLSTEAQKNLSILAEVGMPKIGKLSAKYSRVVKEEAVYTVKFTVRF